MLGNRVAVSPICTIEPRRRKFHKPITLTIPVPQAATRGMINQYTGDAPTLRLLCSITGSTKSGLSPLLLSASSLLSVSLCHFLGSFPSFVSLTVCPINWFVFRFVSFLQKKLNFRKITKI